MTTVFIALICFVFVESLSACTCAIGGTVHQAFSETPNVVIMKLRSVEKYVDGETGYAYGGIKRSKLTVEKIYKGNFKVGQELTFAQGTGADCVWVFSEQEVGTEYLFYLGSKPVKDGIWAAGTCTRSGSTTFAAADLLYLNKMAKVAGKTRVYGRFTQSIAAATEGDQASYNVLPNRRVRISGNGKDLELRTDSNGVYEVYDLPPGKYRIFPEAIEGYDFSYGQKNRDWVEVELKPKGHSEQNFSFRIDNAIRGRVFDVHGKPLRNVCLDLRPARGKQPKHTYLGDCTDENGGFEFDVVPTGTYVIVVNEDGRITADEPFGTFYYPGTTSREDAAEIAVGPGEFRDDLIINAPSAVETITISGVLLFEDGKPATKEIAEYASVQFFAGDDYDAAKEDERQSDSTTLIGENGKFTLRVLKGQRGTLFGELLTFADEYENCPKLEKLIRTQGSTSANLKTPIMKIEAVNAIAGIELRFPFPSCKKAEID